MAKLNTLAGIHKETAGRLAELQRKDEILENVGNGITWQLKKDNGKKDCAPIEAKYFSFFSIGKNDQTDLACENSWQFRISKGFHDLTVA
ncbi:MAG: hypothetical protein AABY22_32205 [Nanoarchaeota archaeon]